MDYDALEAPSVILTAKEVLDAGLKLVRYSEGRIDRAYAKTNTQRFKDHYGCSQFVAAHIFEDLQTTTIECARVEKKKVSIKYFLQALHFLYVYDIENRREPVFDLSPKTMRKWVWYYAAKIQSLKHQKIVWPVSFPDTDVWVVSVDCTDCPIEEIEHPVYSQDKDLFLFKINGAGLRYEYGIDLFSSRVIWMNGPFLPGVFNDNQVFDLKGLHQQLASVGKKALGDKIYNGHPDQCSTFNAVDSEAVRTFKARVQMRHEQFNNYVKEFGCLKKPFRHKPDKIAKHKICFESVTVICQYRMEHGEPLFDLMAGM